MYKKITMALAIGTFALMLWGALDARQIVEEYLQQHALHQHRATLIYNVYAHHGDGVQDVPFHPGDALFVHYKVERLRTCTIYLQFRLTKVRAGDVYTGEADIGYPLVAYFGPPASLETNEYFEIPRGMPTGHYEMRRINIIECNSAKWTEFSPPAPLEIE